MKKGPSRYYPLLARGDLFQVGIVRGGGTPLALEITLGTVSGLGLPRELGEAEYLGMVRGRGLPLALDTGAAIARITTDGDTRITADGDRRIIQRHERVTTDGDRRITTDGGTRVMA